MGLWVIWIGWGNVDKACVKGEDLKETVGGGEKKKVRVNVGSVQGSRYHETRPRSPQSVVSLGRSPEARGDDTSTCARRINYFSPGTCAAPLWNDDVTSRLIYLDDMLYLFMINQTLSSDPDLVSSACTPPNHFVNPPHQV